MKLIIIGNSGHKKVVADVAISLGYEIAGIIDDQFKERFTEGGILYGNSSHIKAMVAETEAKLFFGIGNNKVRALIIKKQALEHDMFATLISPHAIISPSTIIDKGTLIMPGAILNADSKVGKQVIINSGAIVEHDCVVNDYAHISPHATLTGAVKVGKGTQIGALAAVNPTIEVGDWVIVGSGASVIKDIPSNTVAVGVPARIIKSV